MSDKSNLLFPFNLRLTPHWGCCMSATLILLKKSSEFGTYLIESKFNLADIIGTQNIIYGGDIYKQ